MVIKLIAVWNGAAWPVGYVPFPAARADGDGGSDDESLSVPPHERLRRRQRRDEAVLAQRLVNERQRKEKERRDADQRMLLWLIFEQQRQAIQELIHSVADFRSAAQRAYRRATVEEETARVALSETRGGAIVLSDGRHVYFTRDGLRLFGEDRRQLSDERSLEEARRQARIHPGAPDFETYAEKEDAFRSATERALQLADVLHRADDLDEKLKKADGLDAAGLEQLRAELRQLVQSLPPDARQDYEDLRISGHGGDFAYRDVPDLAPAAPAPAGQTVGLNSGGPATTGGEPVSGRKPVYKAVPEF